MIIVNTHEAKTHLSRYLAELEQHRQKIRICRNGKPIADIVPVVQATRSPLIQSDKLKAVKIHYNPVAPLSENEWPLGD